MGNISQSKYRVFRNDCRGFNNLSITIHFIQQYMFLFLFNRKNSNFLLHTLQVLYMCTVCDSTNINTIIQFVPNCLQHVSGDGLNGGSDSYRYTRTLSLESVHTACKWNCEMVVVSQIWCGIAVGQFYSHSRFE